MSRFKFCSNAHENVSHLLANKCRLKTLISHHRYNNSVLEIGASLLGICIGSTNHRHTFDSPLHVIVTPPPPPVSVCDEVSFNSDSSIRFRHSTIVVATTPLRPRPAISKLCLSLSLARAHTLRVHYALELFGRTSDSDLNRWASLILSCTTVVSTFTAVVQKVHLVFGVFYGLVSTLEKSRIFGYQPTIQFGHKGILQLNCLSDRQQPI